MEIKNIADRVKEILTDHEDARNSDRMLYFYYLKLYFPSILDVSMSQFLAMKHAPSIESIGRARRKIQELYPELRPNELTKKSREEREEEFLEFARNY